MIPNCQHSEDITKIAEALGKALPKMESAAKDSRNPHFNSKYADLSAVMEACKPHLAAQGIVVMQPPSTTEDGGAVSVSTVLLHSSGQWIASTLTLRPTKQDPQGMGSAITYARRYSLQSMLGIPAEDDDGNAASQQPTGKAAAKAVADQRIAELKKANGPVSTNDLNLLLGRAAKNAMERDAVYAELGERIEKLTDRDTAEQCWAQANDGRSTPAQIITKLYRAWMGFQEPAA